ncbi:MAG: phosphatase PAP2 family protein [Oscillospiraceae bacterium]
MKRNEKKILPVGAALLGAFVLWTLLIKLIDIKPVGQNETDIGFAALNIRFHRLTGVHMTIYTITDWLGLVPLFVCIIFGVIGLRQLITRRSFFKVDRDIIVLGIYYIAVIICYVIFEIIPINYRPIPINGVMEASYPSSTTLLVLCVMPTLSEQANRRLKSFCAKRATSLFSALFSAFMVIGRLISGVHWFTDIIGGVLLSGGLFFIYKAAVYKFKKM